MRQQLPGTAKLCGASSRVGGYAAGSTRSHLPAAAQRILGGLADDVVLEPLPAEGFRVVASSFFFNSSKSLRSSRFSFCRLSTSLRSWLNSTEGFRASRRLATDRSAAARSGLSLVAPVNVSSTAIAVSCTRFLRLLTWLVRISRTVSFFSSFRPSQDRVSSPRLKTPLGRIASRSCKESRSGSIYAG